MWELDPKEGWAPKNWCFLTVVLEKTLERPLDSKEIKLVNSKENRPWMFTGRTDAETSKLWLPDGKSWLIGKDPDSGKDWRQEKKEVSEDEMVGWHHWLNGHDFEQTQGDSERQESLVCCVQSTRSQSPTRLSNWKFFPCHVPINATDDTPLLKSLEHF